MKRNIIVSNLLKEGFSEKTLVRFTDKQLSDLHERMTVKAVDLNDPNIKKIVSDPTTQVQVVKEKKELKGGQKKLDKNHNGVIDGQDFKILKGQKKEVKEADMGLTVKGSKSSSSSVFGGLPKKSSSPKKKSTPKKKEEGETEEGKDSLHDIIHGAIKDKLKGDLGREPEQHEIEEEHQKYIDGCKTEGDEPKKEDDDKKFPFKKKKEDVEEGDYHNERSEKALEKSKEDFPQLKNIKKCEECEKVESKCKCKKEDVKEVKNWVSNLVENEKFHSFTSKNEIMELIQSKLNESDTMVQTGPQVKKGHNGIPEFMSYDAITSSGPATAPTKPKPTTKPGTKPGTKPETPYNPKPGPNHKPKAIAEEKKLN